MNSKSTRVSMAMAVAGAITMAGMTLAPTPVEAGKGVKCYGIAKAGENSCHSANGSHSCAGQSTVDYDGNEWVAVKNAKSCMEVEGKLEPFNGVNPKKK